MNAPQSPWPTAIGQLVTAPMIANLQDAATILQGTGHGELASLLRRHATQLAKALPPQEIDTAWPCEDESADLASRLPSEAWLG